MLLSLSLVKIRSDEVGFLSFFSFQTAERKLGYFFYFLDFQLDLFLWNCIIMLIPKDHLWRLDFRMAHVNFFSTRYQWYLHVILSKQNKIKQPYLLFFLFKLTLTCSSSLGIFKLTRTFLKCSLDDTKSVFFEALPLFPVLKEQNVWPEATEWFTHFFPLIHKGKLENLLFKGKL